MNKSKFCAFQNKCMLCTFKTYWQLKMSPLLPDGVKARLAPLAFHFRNRVPLKGESPVKASNHRLVCLHVKLKRVPVDGVDHRAHYGAGILSNPKQNIIKKTTNTVKDVCSRNIQKAIKKKKITFPAEAQSSQGHTHSGNQEKSEHHPWRRWRR